MRAVLSVALGLLFYPSSAEACTTTLSEDETSVRTLPANGAEDVPTDVALLVDVSQIRSALVQPFDDFATLRTSTGATLAVEAKPLSSRYVEVKPLQPLAPNTAYELDLRVQGTSEEEPELSTMTFTTGAGPEQLTDVPLNASLQHYVFSDDVQLSTCDRPRSGTCVVLPDDVLVTVTYFKRGQSTNEEQASLDSDDNIWGEPVTSIATGSFGSELGFDYSSDWACVRLQHRRANGSHGEPVVLCGSDAPTFELFDNSSLECTSQGIEHSGKMERKTPGCAVSPISVGSDSRPGAVATALLLAALGSLRRRTRR